MTATLEDRISALERTIEIEAATAARRRCLNADGSRKKGGTFDCMYQLEMHRLTGRMPVLATYAKKREGLSPAQTTAANKAARARADVEQRRARGERIDSAQSEIIFRKYCG